VTSVTAALGPRSRGAPGHRRLSRSTAYHVTINETVTCVRLDGPLNHHHGLFGLPTRRGLSSNVVPSDAGSRFMHCCAKCCTRNAIFSIEVAVPVDSNARFEHRPVKIAVRNSPRHSSEMKRDRDDIDGAALRRRALNLRRPSRPTRNSADTARPSTPDARTSTRITSAPPRAEQTRPASCVAGRREDGSSLAEGR
jgi:hypothetical protein